MDNWPSVIESVLNSFMQVVSLNSEAIWQASLKLLVAWPLHKCASLSVEGSAETVGSSSEGFLFQPQPGMSVLFFRCDLYNVSSSLVAETVFQRAPG